MGRGPPLTWYVVSKGACCLAPCARADSMTIAEFVRALASTFGGRRSHTRRYAWWLEGCAGGRKTTTARARFTCVIREAGISSLERMDPGQGWQCLRLIRDIVVRFKDWLL